MLPFKARVLFYNGLVLPLFDYADIVWGDKNNITLMDKLQTMQNKAAKIILNEPLYSSASEALARLNWITLKQRRFYHSCLLIYKCINGYTYHSMDLLTLGDSHGYNTRNRDNLRLPRVTRNWGKQRVSYQGVVNWNSLNKDIKDPTNIRLFKYKLLNALQHS